MTFAKLNSFLTTLRSLERKKGHRERRKSWKGAKKKGGKCLEGTIFLLHKLATYSSVHEKKYNMGKTRKTL